MNESKEDIKDNNENKEVKILIETVCESGGVVIKNQDDDEKGETKPEVQKKEALKINNTETKNPLLYEIGPLPRRPQKIWVQVLGMDAIRSEGETFEYSPSRNDFVRLVFSLVLIMLICTAAFCVACNVVGPIRDMFEDRSILILILALIITLIATYAFALSPCARVAPCSYICLGITVIGFGLICAYFTIKYTQVVVLALFATTAVVVVCLILACTSFDFTKFLLYVIVAATAFAAISLAIFLFMTFSGVYLKPLHIAMLIIGTMIHSISLVIELQMVLGGKTVELAEEDYALGAFLIYTSIISIFINMLQLLGIGLDDVL